MQIFSPSVSFVANDHLFKAAFFFKNKLPVLMLDKLSKIPGIGTASLKKNVEKGKLMTTRAWETGILFDHFTTNSWIYESLQVEELMKLMKPEEISEFYIDPKVIDWSHTVQSYVHGIQKFCLK
jgi:fatty acyl-CoA reductase